MNRLPLRRGDGAVVIGLGSIGLLLTELGRLRGVRCLGVDLDPARREFARTLGVSGTSDGSPDSVRKWIADVSEGRGADAVIVTAGRPEMVGAMLSWLRSGGTLNIFSSFHPEHTLTLDWNDLYYREINVVTTYSSSPGDLSEALKLLAARKVRVSALSKKVFSLERFQEALDSLHQRAIMKAIIAPHANG
jgi:L-iditol 2-dehydrogenase